jgi:hypothetical protein
MPIHPNTQKEQFSKAYVHAVATLAGYSVYDHRTDEDSIDIGISDTGAQGTVRSPRLELQCKCTESPSLTALTFPFPVKIKNYNDLRDTNVMVPRIIVIVLVPELLPDWSNHSEVEMALRRCAYWHSLRGMPVTTNTQSVNITIDRNNQFSASGLAAIMQRLSTGGLP